MTIGLETLATARRIAAGEHALDYLIEAPTKEGES